MSMYEGVRIRTEIESPTRGFTCRRVGEVRSDRKLIKHEDEFVVVRVQIDQSGTTRSQGMRRTVAMKA